MFPIIISVIVLIALIIASITDIKTREVPDWLNFSLVGLGLGIRLIWSLITKDNSFILAGIFGFGAFFILALIMFYTAQWGGGDSKMLMGLGALIGIPFKSGLSLLNIMQMPFLSFLINMLIIGSVYGLVWSFIMCLRKRKKFVKEWKKSMSSNADFRKIMLIGFIVLIILIIFVSNVFVKILLLCLLIMIYLSFYLLIFIKAVEKACMLKYVKPTEVTEGDWIAKDIIVDKKYLAGPKDLGIEKKQLKKLISYYNKGKIKRVLIKIGIPFIPSFLIAYILTLIFGNVLMMFV